MEILALQDTGHVERCVFPLQDWHAFLCKSFLAIMLPVWTNKESTVRSPGLFSFVTCSLLRLLVVDDTCLLISKYNIYLYPGMQPMLAIQ